jgi:hypothetical protein
MWLMAAVDNGTGNATKSIVEGVSATQDQIMLALIALVGTSIAALVYIIRNGRTAQGAADDAAVAAKQATAANNAVNNVGPGKSTLYNMVERIDKRSAETNEKVAGLSADMRAVKTDVTRLKKEQDEYDSHGWGTLPLDLGTAVGLTTTIRDLQNGHKQVNEKLDTIISEIREHVMWEMGVKHMQAPTEPEA